MPSFRPGWIVQLLVRMDEGKGAAPGTDPGIGSKKPTSPNAVSAATDDPNVEGFLVVPHSVEWNSSSYRSCDTAKMTFDYLQFPLPADAVRGGTITIHADNIQDEAVDENGLSVLPATEDNLRFVGLIDEYFEDVDEGEIRIEARDYTGPLLDQKPKRLNPGDKLPAIDQTLPLDIAIAQFILTHPIVAHSIVVYIQDSTTGALRASDGSLPKPGAHRPAAHGQSIQQHHQSTPDSNYWSLIQEACAQTGFICFIRREKLIITTAKNVLDLQVAAHYPVMLFGQNLSRLNYKRKFGRVKARIIWIKSWCPDIGKPLTGIYPRPGSPEFANLQANQVSTINPHEQGQASQDIAEFEVEATGGNERGAQQLLDKVAENTYFAMAKSTLSGHFATEDSWSYDVDQVGPAPRPQPPPAPSPTNPNLWSLSSGNPIEIGIRPLAGEEPDGPPASMFMGMSEEEISTYLVTRRGFTSQKVANQIAQHIKSGTRNRVFRVKSACFKCSKDNGFELQVDFTDYIQAHDDPNRRVLGGKPTIRPAPSRGP